MSEFSVLKFGGTSVSRPEAVAEIFMANPDRNKIAVLSAIGKEPGEQNGYPKVTDKLIELEEAVIEGDYSSASTAKEFIIERYRYCYSMLGEKALKEVCDDAYRLMRSDNRSNGYRWIGEHMSARLFSKLTGAAYVPTGLRFSGGVLQLKSSIAAIRESVGPFVKRNRQVVTEGYFGFDLLSGRQDTLPRGGSDTTGVIYAGAMDGFEGSQWINECYTDRDGILSADPDIVGERKTKLIAAMTHKEVREKMHGITERNGVIHGDAIAFAARLGVEIDVKNTFNPDSPGTRITETRQSDPKKPIIGISGKGSITVISAYDLGMADAVGYLERVLSQVRNKEMSVSHIPTGEESVGLVFNSDAKPEDLAYVRNHIKDNAISGDKAEVDIVDDLGIVYLVGQELTKPTIYTQMLGRVASIMADSGYDIREVVSHEKSPSLALTVNGSEVGDIIRVLHSELIEPQIKYK